MKITHSIELTREEIKLACILYARESATGKVLESLRDPEDIQINFIITVNELLKTATFECVALELPSVAVVTLGKESHG